MKDYQQSEIHDRLDQMVSAVWTDGVKIEHSLSALKGAKMKKIQPD